jgi:hypothetical protein
MRARLEGIALVVLPVYFAALLLLRTMTAVARLTLSLLVVLWICLIVGAFHRRGSRAGGQWLKRADAARKPS